MEAIRRPADCIAEIADSRPAPGPLTLISTSRTPLRIAVLAQFWAACWAAKGVLLREPLKPTHPADLEQMVSPSISVTVIKVLLNVALMCTIARTTFLLTLRFALFAICVSYRMFLFVFRYSPIRREVSAPPDGTDRHLSFLLDAFLSGDGLPGALAGARVALGALPPNRQALSMSNSSIAANIAQARDVLRDLSSKLASDDIVAVDDLCYSAKLIFAELAGLGHLLDSGFLENLLRRIPAYSRHVRQ
jgi:hypothetical protein